MNFRQTDMGFTIFEIIVAICIMTLAVTIVIFSFSKLNSSQALDKSATLVVSTLGKARSLTLSSVGASQYGVNFQESQVVLFKGATYSSSDISNVVIGINPLVSLRDVTLSGGGASVVFKRLTGDTDETGTLKLFLKSSPETFHTITIGRTGIAESD